MIEAVTKIRPEMTFIILFADLPDNDFTVAAKVANEHFKERKNVYPTLVGKSFY